MSGTKAQEQHEGSTGRPQEGRDASLDRRYGEIGISAVAAAVCHKGEQRPAGAKTKKVLQFDYDCD